LKFEDAAQDEKYGAISAVGYQLVRVNPSSDKTLEAQSATGAAQSAADGLYALELPESLADIVCAWEALPNDLKDQISHAIGEGRKTAPPDQDEDRTEPRRGLAG
jgi:hypothetical protein